MASSVSLAAPGPLADVPVFLSTSTQPNVFYLIDDSLSMDYQFMTDDAEGIMNIRGVDYFYTQPLTDNALGSFPGGASFVPPTEESIIASVPGETPPYGGVWRAWNSDYNKLYYDPGVTYLPWEGVDKNGDVFSFISPLAALLDPWDPDAGTVDLTARISYITSYVSSTGTSYSFNVPPFYPARYHTWVDDDGDGIVDPEDSHTLVEITTPDELQNFANWFTYYRKREYAAKGALASVIEPSSNRVGMATLNDNNSVSTPVKDVDDITSPVDGTAASNKRALMDNVFRIDTSPASGTPLRSQFDHVGRYFKNDGSGPLFSAGSVSTPILPSASGGACQQNFVTIMTDGFWNGAAPSPSPGNADGDNNTAWDGGSYADAVPDTLADVAMKYFETDLSPHSDFVPPGGRDENPDENPQQHLVTFGVAFGVNGTLDSDPPNTEDAFAWPTPTADSPETIDDLRHAAWNGRGEFINALQPGELAGALDNVVVSVSNRNNVAAAATLDSFNITDGATLLRTGFNSGTWEGLLTALDVSVTTDVDGDTDVTLTDRWNAHTLLSSRDLTADPRLLVTWDDDSAAALPSPTGIVFDAASLTAAQRSDLLVNAPFPADTTDAGEIAANNAWLDRIIDWFGGAATNEVGEAGGTGEFRSRTFDDGRNILGDIVHASSLFVGPPDAAYPDNLETASYRTFIDTYASRPELVVTPANDGGIHIFRAGSGEELAFYLPAALFSDQTGRGLHVLADPSYTHRFYADLTPTVADVFVGGNWRTYLVGGLRGGGRGVHVLDLTNASNFIPGGGTSAADAAAALVKHEFTHPDLGYSFSRPQIARMNNGRWVAIFGNGYNSDLGKAVLFILDLQDFSVIALDTESGPATVDGSGDPIAVDCRDGGPECNGMSTPEILDLNGDLTVDRIVAGDVRGNLWAFDVSNVSTLSWGSAYTSGGSPEPLFRARDATGNEQPITVQPSVIRHPTKAGVATFPNLLISFGTGQLLGLADNASTTRQTFYTVWDRGDTSDIRRTDLNRQSITTVTAATGETVRLMSDGADGVVNYDTTGLGWLANLPATRERVVTDSASLGELVFFNTSIPSGTVCGAGGIGWLMAVDLATGANPALNTVDFNENGVFDEGDKVDDENIAGTGVDALPTSSSFSIDGEGITRWVVDSLGVLNVDDVQPLARFGPARLSWTPVELQ